MKDGYIALLDSGIGGISLLLQLKKILPNEKYLYLGDNYNAPYGSKHIATLRDLTLNNIDLIKRYDVKLLCVACNTLSVNLLAEIRKYSNLPTFGVFPPVERAVFEGKRNLLIATERTAENYKNIKGVTAIGLKNLARDIEYNMFALDKVSLLENFKNHHGFICQSGCYDSVILGCTHYFFIKNKIFDHFQPRKILFGEYFTVQSVKKYLKNTKSLVNYKQNEVLFIGKNSKLNQKFFNFNLKNF